MRYLDVTSKQEERALATSEDEAEQKNSKKWKNISTAKLKKFCGLDYLMIIKKYPNGNVAKDV